MRTKDSWARSFRWLAVLLAQSQILIGLPPAVAAAQTTPTAPKKAAPSPAPPAIKVNRTVPKVTPPSALPRFSQPPTDLEIFGARVFEEPLVAIGATKAEENQELAEAILAYLQAGRPEDVAPLEAFLSRHVQSPWRAGLLTNLGTVYRRTGYFSQAYASWEEAWTLAKHETEPNARAIADKALGELSQLAARLGRMDALDTLLTEANTRVPQGSVTEKITGAKEGLWVMRNKPERAFRCGPMALDRILVATRAGYQGSELLTESRSTINGTSLAQMEALAANVGLSMQMAFRSPGSKVIVPAMVHWKAGHFAALVREKDGRYLMQDPTFGDEMWVSIRALDTEGSGYALVPEGSLGEGWRRVQTAEGKTVWGKGVANGPDDGGTGSGGAPPPPGAPGGGSCNGLAGYTYDTLVAGLQIVDTPVAYTPARGPGASFTVRYSQREASQPQIFTYSNLGPKWTFEWLSYIEDDGTSNPNQTINVYLRGGGREVITGFDPGTSSYALGFKTQAVIVRNPPTPNCQGQLICYERRLPDGSVEVYSQSDGAANPRKVFMTAAVDPQGNRLSFTYDAELRLVAATDALGQVTTVSYELPSDSRKVTKVTDPFGRYATFEYDSLGRLVRITDVLGLTSEFGYATGDFIGTLTTPYGTTTFSKGDNGYNRWIESVDPQGGRERLEYINWGANGVPTSGANPPGYGGLDLNDTLTAYWDKRAMAVAPGNYAGAHLTHWMRSSFNQAAISKSFEKRPFENRVWYSYPGQSSVGTHRYIGTVNLPSEMARVLDDGTVQSTHYEYNVRGVKIKEIDPLGRETVYVYGTDNVPDPVPATGTGIDLLQAKVKNNASAGGWDATASYAYDAEHQPLTVTDGAGQTTTYTYTANGQVETVTTPARAGITEDRTTTYTYDPVTGNLMSVVGPGSVTTSYTYEDPYPRLRTTTDTDGYTLTYDYDDFDRPTQTTYPDLTFEKTEYERLDPVRRRDRLGRWSHTFYDPLRRVSATRDVAGRLVRQEWCTCGSLERLIDANGNATAWDHDSQGRVIKETRANGSFKTTVYETTTSRIKKVVDAKLQETQFGYAKDDKVLTISYVNAEHPTPNVTLSYIDPATGAPDAHGRLRQVTDGTGTTTYAYHPFGQLGAGQLASVDGPLANDTITYGYDELGRVVSRTLNGATTTWAYDALGRLTTIGDPVGDFVYGYVGSTGRVGSVTYPNGQTSGYAYYPLEQDLRLQEIHHRRPGGATLNRFTYTYDVAGNILAWGQQTDSNPVQTYTFEYDRADQLTAATLAAATPRRYRYAYDPAGNRTTEQVDDVATSATYDTMNRLTTQGPGGILAFRGMLNEPAAVTVGGTPAGVSAGNQFSGAAAVPSGTSQVVVTATDPSGNLRTNTYEVTQTGATKAFTYDANGNLTGDGTRTYEWDAENRLTAVKEGPNTLASFTYDGSRRRATKSAAGVTTTYVYDGAQFLEARASTGSTKRYAYGPGVDQPLAQSFAGVASYFVADHLGSVARLTDAAGAPTLTREYDPWGNLLQGSAATGYAFTGREWDPETALYYYRARYYDSSLGRFMTEDPAGIDGGLNLFAYVVNRPVSWADPYGLKAPQYNPGKWNAPDVVRINNCYNYAWDMLNTMRTSPMNPGEFSGRKFTRLECQDIIQAAKRDGFVDVGPNGTCGQRCHLVKLYITTDGYDVQTRRRMGPDYHWARKDSNSRWSSKHGQRAVGPQVSDPDIDARAWNYTIKCGSLCAPDR